MLFEFPTKEDWAKLMRTFPFNTWDVPKFGLQVDQKSVDVMNQFQANLSLPIWEMHLANRLSDIQQSYGLLLFYYELGILDDKGMISPGKHGVSIDEKHHYQIKDQFDYYTDVFYYKAFSAWDTVGQLLNEIYQLGLDVKDVNFHKCIKKLKSADNVLQNEFLAISQHSEFEKAKEFRHSISHRHPANKQGPSFRKIDREGVEGFTFGECSVTPSREIVENVKSVLELITITLEKLKGRCNSFRTSDDVVMHDYEF